jgi:hypothetical protein
VSCGERTFPQRLSRVDNRPRAAGLKSRPFKTTTFFSPFKTTAFPALSKQRHCQPFQNSDIFSNLFSPAFLLTVRPEAEASGYLEAKTCNFVNGDGLEREGAGLDVFADEGDGGFEWGAGAEDG